MTAARAGEAPQGPTEILLACAALVVFAAASPTLEAVEKVAGRYHLSNGDTLEAVYSDTGGRHEGVASLIVKDVVAGRVVTIIGKVDYITFQTEATYSDGKSSFRIWTAAGFGKDNLAIPIEVKIGDRYSRALAPLSNERTPEIRRIQGEIAKLPEEFLNTLRKLGPLAREFPAMAVLFVAAEQFLEPLPSGVSISARGGLKGEEIGALLGVAAGRD